MSDDTDCERAETMVPADRLVRELGDRIHMLEHKERELGEIRATLYVNFIKRETYGVQITDDCDRSDQQLMMEVFKRIGAENERLQSAINDAAESGDVSHLVSTNSQSR